MSKPSISVIYDDIGDALYIWIGKHPRVKDEEDEDGLYLRYDSDTNAPAGALVVDYKEYWRPKQSHLVARLSKFLGVSQTQTEKAIKAAI